MYKCMLDMDLSVYVVITFSVRLLIAGIVLSSLKIKSRKYGALWLIVSYSNIILALLLV